MPKSPADPGPQMHFFDSNFLYAYTADEKEQIRNEIGLKDNNIKEDVSSILEWFNKQPHLAAAPINHDMVERMILIAKGSREKAKSRIDNFYRYRAYAQDVLESRLKFFSDPTENGWKFYHQSAMLNLFEGKRISVVKITDPNPDNFFCDVLFRNTIMLGDLRLKYDYMLGDIWIIDLENVSFGHITRLNPSVIKKSSNIFQEGMGVRVFALHLINAPTFVNNLLNFMKQFVKAKIMDRVVIHDNLKSLYEHIPKSHLPKDFGGDQPSLDEFKEMYLKELQRDQTRDYLTECCQQISDESRRPTTQYPDDLVGSFKKLDFD
ncbi:alpha-tocopherol transfer protein-like [Leptidea sinapis]|uniref:alpha-tocopherol transfer protein-like n=1 Tax=Leptidea sinapis TaxID=189913 RepID=UPI0021C4BE67|nr:alpha-tocopherol transfer protein-like [Leptidea sinapis]